MIWNILLTIISVLPLLPLIIVLNAVLRHFFVPNLTFENLDPEKKKTHLRVEGKSIIWTVRVHNRPPSGRLTRFIGLRGRAVAKDSEIHLKMPMVGRADSHSEHYSLIWEVRGYPRTIDIEVDRRYSVILMMLNTEDKTVRIPLNPRNGLTPSEGLIIDSATYDILIRASWKKRWKSVGRFSLPDDIIKAAGDLGSKKRHKT